MSSRFHDPAARDAAIADFYASGDSMSAVAKRHGIPRATFTAWVSEGDIAYRGGWYFHGGIMRPVAPERGAA